MASVFDGFEWPAWSLQCIAGSTGIFMVSSALQWLVKPRDTGGDDAPLEVSAEFKTFQRQYLVVYLVIMMADWLQGTNMYTLYSSYGMDVGTLFLIGFTSSGIFSMFIGPVVDRKGRKWGCIVFCVLEVVINVLEHVPSFYILAFGRVLGGLSTALLFTAFEAWMVSAHRKRKFPEKWLASTFGLQSVGNGVVAIVAGVVAQVSADRFGDIGPFQVAIALTVLALALIMGLWDENYGAMTGTDSQGVAKAASWVQSTQQTLAVVAGSRQIQVVCLIQSFFEGAMYSFVFMWVPTLIGASAAHVPSSTLPTGLVFSAFMICVVVGGQMYDVALRVTSIELGSALCFGLAAVAMLTPVLTSSLWPLVVSFLLVEACVGFFYGAMPTLRSRCIPDDLQSSVMNILRVPLNGLVIFGTSLGNRYTTAVTFGVIASWFGAASLLTLVLLMLPAPAAEKAPAAAAGAKAEAVEQVVNPAAGGKSPGSKKKKKLV